LKTVLKQILLTLFLLAGFEVQAQDAGSAKFSFEFRGDTLSEALDQITRNSGIDLVYDPQLVQGHHVYQRLQNKEVHSVLKSVLKEFQLDYLTLSSGTIVIVRSASEGPFFGTFSGRITDSETGAPLPDATVLLADASGGTSTNQAGNFSLNKLMAGTHTVIFSYVGYEPVIKTFEIGPNEQVREQVHLQPKPQYFSPVVVESHRQRVPGQQALSNPNSAEVQSGAAMNDAIRSLSFIPGVQYGLPMTSLHLQGGHRGEHRILLDGVPVYNPYSFGQLFSSFSPYAIGSIELHKAGYGVKQGSQISGLVNLSHDLTNAENKQVIVQADPLSLNVRGDLGFEFGDASLNIMTALRTHFWGLYRDPNLEQTLQNWDVMDPLITNLMADLDTDASYYSPIFHDSEVRFFDYHFAASYKADDFNRVSTSLYFAENTVETHLLNQADTQQSLPPYIYSADQNDWRNLLAQFTWDKIVTPRLDISTQASLSTNRFEHQNRTGISYNPVMASFGEARVQALSELHADSPIPLPSQIDGNTINHVTLKTDANYSFSPSFSLQAGIRGDRIHTSVELEDATNFSILNDQSSTLLGAFINNSHTFGNFWSIDWGSRFTYVSQNNNIYPEPRFSAQYDRPDSRYGFWSARISGGLYRQFINEFRITNASPTSVVPSFAIWSHAGDLDTPKAWHLKSSFLFEPAENTSLKIEAYYKWQPVTNISSYVNLNDQNIQPAFRFQSNEVSAFAETTEMTALGGGLHLNHSLMNSRIDLLAGYDYSYSRIRMDSQFGQTLPAPWNEPQRLQLRALWHVVPKLTVVSKWQGIWGRSWAFRESYYNFLPFRDSALSLPHSFDTPENDNLPAFHQMDLSVIYQPGFGPAELEIRLELINLLNRNNTLDKYFLPVFDAGEQTGYDIHSRTFPGFYPSVSISATF
jgi:hypothetical protein